MKNARAFAALGINRTPEIDFIDDGTHFSGYEYKGLPITYVKAEGKMYFCMRVDYLRDLTSSDYINKEWWRTCDLFNGVEEIDKVDLLIALEKVVQGVRELREEISNSELDFTDLIDRKTDEIIMINEKINEVKEKFNWLEADNYSVSSVRSKVKALENYRNQLINLSEVNTPVMREHLHRVKTSGYIYLKEKCYYIEMLNSLIEQHHY